MSVMRIPIKSFETIFQPDLWMIVRFMHERDWICHWSFDDAVLSSNITPPTFQSQFPFDCPYYNFPILFAVCSRIFSHCIHHIHGSCCSLVHQATDSFSLWENYEYFRFVCAYSFIHSAALHFLYFSPLSISSALSSFHIMIVFNSFDEQFSLLSSTALSWMDFIFMANSDDAANHIMW